MEQIFLDTNWLAVILSAIAAFAVGAFWYSEKLFGKRWRNGIGTPAVSTKSYMFYGMISQFISTLFLSFIVSATILMNSMWSTIIITIMLAGFIKAHGFYAGKTKTAISIEVLYILVMVVVMCLVQNIWY
jgi:hypothetical protein